MPTDQPAHHSEWTDDALARYARQMIFEPIGREGQEALARSRVVLVGCGALGSVLANTLVRSGVGYIRLIDRDFLELNNLQRQVLFDENDIAENLPKAVAAARKLAAINSDVRVEPLVADVNHTNVESLCDGADLLLDGTDNFETRFLINDLAVKTSRPWVYGACIGADGLVMPILPGKTPCLRCIWEDAPPPGVSPTCETAGVVAPIVNLVASFQAVLAMRILMGQTDEMCHDLLTIDGWSCRVRGLNMQSARDHGDCPCCRRGSYDFLAGKLGSSTTALCGRNAVQILPSVRGHQVSFADIADRLDASAAATHNRHMLRFQAEQYEITVFADGRAIIRGTNEASTARSIYARYVGA
jgi:adenylyltransferase/sulfurtransferase